MRALIPTFVVAALDVMLLSDSHDQLAGDVKSPNTPTAIVLLMHILLLAFALLLTFVTGVAIA